MKIVFSRKGFDSQNGGYPSPIFPDGRMLSLPIPERGSGTKYADLSFSDSQSYYDIMRELGMKRIAPDVEAHLDPDLSTSARPRLSGWTPVFGQCKAAQIHLDREGIAAGDIFLFFGLYRQVESFNGSIRYAPRSPQIHMMFGYLQVDRIVRVNGTTNITWASEHPHLVNRNRRNNALYVARDKLTLDPRLPGAGVFTYQPKLQLTDEGANTSVWRLPLIFHPDVSHTPMTYHGDPSRWATHGNEAILQTVAKGQEFVITATPEIKDWVNRIVS